MYMKIRNRPSLEAVPRSVIKEGGSQSTDHIHYNIRLDKY